MPGLDDQKLDELLRGHARLRLGPVSGDTARHVMKAIVLAPPAAPSFWTKLRPYWKPAGIAAALGVGLSTASFALYDNVIPDSWKRSRLIAAQNDEPIKPETTTVSWWQTFDAGNVLLEDETPARMLQRVQFEKRTTRNADGTTSTELLVPQRDVIFVEMETR